MTVLMYATHRGANTTKPVAVSQQWPWAGNDNALITSYCFAISDQLRYFTISSQSGVTYCREKIWQNFGSGLHSDKALVPHAQASASLPERRHVRIVVEAWRWHWSVCLSEFLRVSPVIIIPPLLHTQRPLCGSNRSFKFGVSYRTGSLLIPEHGIALIVNRTNAPRVAVWVHQRESYFTVDNNI
jgi:hypothetical protein